MQGGAEDYHTFLHTTKAVAKLATDFREYLSASGCLTESTRVAAVRGLSAYASLIAENGLASWHAVVIANPQKQEEWVRSRGGSSNLPSRALALAKDFVTSRDPSRFAERIELLKERSRSRQK